MLCLPLCSCFQSSPDTIVAYIQIKQSKNFSGQDEPDSGDNPSPWAVVPVYRRTLSYAQAIQLDASTNASTSARPNTSSRTKLKRTKWFDVLFMAGSMLVFVADICSDIVLLCAYWRQDHSTSPHWWEKEFWWTLIFLLLPSLVISAVSLRFSLYDQWLREYQIRQILQPLLSGDHNPLSCCLNKRDPGVADLERVLTSQQSTMSTLTVSVFASFTDRCLNFTVLIIIHLLQLAPILRFLTSIVCGIQSILAADNEKAHTYYSESLHAWNDTNFLKVIESFLEAAPQLTLQLYILVQMEQIVFFSPTVISALISLGSLCVTLATYKMIVHELRHNSDSLLSVAFSCLASALLISSRVLSLALFGASGSSHLLYLLLGVAAHWLLMSIWLCCQKTHFCSSHEPNFKEGDGKDNTDSRVNSSKSARYMYDEPDAAPFRPSPFELPPSLVIHPSSAQSDSGCQCESACEVLYAMIMAGVYVFCFFPAKEGRNRYKMAFYYTICYLESAFLIIFWYLEPDLEGPAVDNVFLQYSVLVLIYVLAAPLVALFLILPVYYKFLHHNKANIFCVFHPDSQPTRGSFRENVTPNVSAQVNGIFTAREDGLDNNPPINCTSMCVNPAASINSPAPPPHIFITYL